MKPLFAAAFLAVIGGVTPRTGFAQTDELQAWLAKSAVPVRSLEAADEDFSDLEPLVKAIGNARVVQLGELSHGSGSHFAAKVRLAKFLHQRMGFDVLLWESGLYSLTFVEAGLRSGADPVESARRGIFPLWSTMEQVRPIFEYAQAARATPRPLEMGGFDLQFSSAKPGPQFAADLRGFAAALADPEARKRATGLVEEMLAGYARFSVLSEERDKQYAEMSRKGVSLKDTEAPIKAWEEREGPRLAAKPEELKAFLAAAGGLLELMQTRSVAFDQVHSPRAVDFMRHVIESFRDQATSTYEMNAIDRPLGDAQRPMRNLGWNRRDTRNALNLRWLIDDYYRGRKIMLWAHNGHVMNAYYAADWRSIGDKPQPEGMKPMGAFLKEWYGDQVYSVGMTGYEGKDKHMFRDEVLTIAPAADGSLEQRLHRLGKPYLFVDFRQLDKVPGHPLRQPQAMRIRGPGEPETMPDLTKVFDGVLYVDALTPAVRIKPAVQPATAAPPQKSP